MLSGFKSEYLSGLRRNPHPETLDQVLELAYQQQSLGPLTNLFDEEEAALAVYEQSVAKVRELEGRWSAVSLALAYEKERTMAG
jgi:hypothetical protein